MPESEFDKQVQRELEGLRIRPSTTVWENVEKELRQKKRRRIVIVFWMIAGIALLGSSTYFLTGKDDKTLAETSSSTGRTGTGSPVPAATVTGEQTAAPNSGETVSSSPDTTPDLQLNTPTDHKQPASKENASGKENIKRNISAPHGNKNTAVKDIQPGGMQQDNVRSTVFSKNNKTGSHGRITASEPVGPSMVKAKAKRPAQNSKEDLTAATATENITEIPVNDMRQEMEDVAKESQKDIAEAIPVSDSAGLQTDSIVDIIKDDNDFGVPVNVLQKKGAKNIRWSLDLAIGGSGPVSRPFLVGDNHADMAYDNLQSSPTQGGGLWQPVNPPGNAFGPVYSQRSDIRPGLFYRAGVLLEMPLSEHVSFSTGLQYQYLSNNIRIGSYVNSRLVFSNFASQQVQANGVYQGAQMKTFTNRYHYLQIPLLFNWQLNKSRKMPVILNTGFSAGYLVSTNALTYDTLQGGTYYHDNNAFKRFQFSFTTGVSFRFGNNRAMQWSIGPEASMGLRKIVKTEYDTRQYPLYIGVQGRIYLPKKK